MESVAATRDSIGFSVAALKTSGRRAFGLLALERPRRRRRREAIQLCSIVIVLVSTSSERVASLCSS